GINAVLAVSSLSGHLLDSKNQGVCGGSLSASGANGSAYANTAADGSYSLTLPAGDYSLSLYYQPGLATCAGAANYPQYSTQGIQVTVAAGAVKDLFLPPVYTVSGKVMDAQGAAIAGANISFSNTPYPTGTTGTTGAT